MGELIFDKYEIRNRIAVGGMGEVFYAVQTQKSVRGFERPVILKSLLPDLAGQDGFIDQFLDEARVAATLNHPNVVSIYEVGLWNGVYFIAMEYIGGRNIAQIMKHSVTRALPVPPAVIARITHDAALGLDHAHNASDSTGAPLNIVHRDISPQNIMVREDGVTKVVDFGIARASNRSTRTATGAVKGKLAYMAPEQLLSKPLTGQTDQFALGIVLWEMCSGRRLFTAERDIDLIKKVLDEPIPNPALLVPGFPEELGEIAARMVERDPSKRFANLADAAKDLSTFLMKVSPPSAESPVKGYLKVLGVEDGKPNNRATPSNQNFVISLKVAKDAQATPDADEDVPLGSIVLTTPEPIKVMVEKSKRRTTNLWVMGVFFVATALGGAGYLALRPDEQPVVNPVVKPVVVVPPVEPPKVDVPKVPTPVVAAPGKLPLDTVPSGANVRFDGRPFTTPVVIEGAPGSHVFMIEKPGFRRVEFELQFESGQLPPKVVQLEKLPVGKKPNPTQPVANTQQASAASNAPGFLSFNTTPWTKVSIGNEPLGSTPLFKRPLAPGKHVLTLVNEGENIRTTRVVEIKSGETAKIDFNLK